MYYTAIGSHDRLTCTMFGDDDVILQDSNKNKNNNN